MIRRYFDWDNDDFWDKPATRRTVVMWVWPQLSIIMGMLAFLIGRG